MKTLLLIRHAKSSWDDLLLHDFDRPLNARGLKDAPLMAQRIKARKIKIDGFISSPANRAKSTCELFMKEFAVNKKEMILQTQIYLATPEVLLEAVKQINNHFETAAVFAHNSGITDFANSLTSLKVDNMPTCSVFAVKVHTNNWSEFKTAKKEFLFFDYPKLLK
jgi:phosphohistidine phosphatase